MNDPAAGTDPQDVAEAIDEDNVRTDPGYTGDEPVDYPPERPMGSLAQAITPLDEEVGETAAERARREEPDVFERADERTERFEDVELDPGVEEDIAAEVAELLREDEDDEVAEGRPIGEIYDPDAEVDGEPTYDDAEAEEIGLAGEPLGDEAAEEAAMHLTEAPPWHQRDGYV
jgi:hypothetical protein